MNGIFTEFAERRRCGDRADGDAAQRLVKTLQDYITANFYHCTNEILAGLGRMYIGDKRFKNAIDGHGAGTAEFVFEAIEMYCKN